MPEDRGRGFDVAASAGPVPRDGEVKRAQVEVKRLSSDTPSGNNLEAQQGRAGEASLPSAGHRNASEERAGVDDNSSLSSTMQPLSQLSWGSAAALRMVKVPSTCA